jgi:Uma2 family endonuclease
MTAATRTFTVDDLIKLGPDARVEVTGGELVEMTPTGGRHVFIVDNLYRLLYPTVEKNRLGYLFTDNLLHVLSASEESVRIARAPDVSFIHRDDVKHDWNVDRPYPAAPTLAVEVMSPDDQIEDVVRKVQEYLDAGTTEVWVVLPREQVVYRYRRGESQVQTYRAPETMDVGALFPGLMLPLADVFALPDLG